MIIKFRTAEDAVTNKLADKLMYKDEILAELRSKLGIGENDKISMMTMSKYINAPDKTRKIVKPKIK